MAWEREDSMLMRDLDLLHPAFAPQAKGLYESARAVGLPVKVWETLRDHRRQAAYYAEGRETDGPIITWAKPGESAHEWGMAVDIVLDIPGVSPWAGVVSWAESKGRVKASREKLLERQEYGRIWLQLADIARELGLVSGLHNWGWDWPHFQLKNFMVFRPDDWQERVRYRLEEGVKGD